MIILSSRDRFCSEVETEFLCTVYMNIGLQNVKSFICKKIILHMTFPITFMKQISFLHILKSCVNM